MNDAYGRGSDYYDPVVSRTISKEQLMADAMMMKAKNLETYYGEIKSILGDKLVEQIYNSTAPTATTDDTKRDAIKAALKISSDTYAEQIRDKNGPMYERFITVGMIAFFTPGYRFAKVVSGTISLVWIWDQNTGAISDTDGSRGPYDRTSLEQHAISYFSRYVSNAERPFDILKKLHSEFGQSGSKLPTIPAVASDDDLLDTTGFLGTCPNYYCASQLNDTLVGESGKFGSVILDGFVVAFGEDTSTAYRSAIAERYVATIFSDNPLSVYYGTNSAIPSSVSDISITPASDIAPDPSTITTDTTEHFETKIWKFQLLKIPTLRQMVPPATFPQV